MVDTDRERRQGRDLFWVSTAAELVRPADTDHMGSEVCRRSMCEV